MKIRIKADMKKLVRRVRAWVRAIDDRQREDLKAYAADFSRLALKFTPPGNGRIGTASAVAKLKTRIRRDFEGDGLVPYDDGNIVWRTKNGQHYAVFADDNGTITSRKPSPFRVIRGRVTPQKLAGLQKGRRGTQWVGSDVHAFMKTHGGQYRLVGSPVRLRWHGARHLVSLASVRAEIRRRQARAGRLMAGWSAVAHFGKVALPSAVARHHGAGYIRIRKDKAHGAVLTAHNVGNFSEMQAIVDKNLPKIRAKFQNTARRRAKITAQKLRKTS